MFPNSRLSISISYSNKFILMKLSFFSPLTNAGLGRIAGLLSLEVEDINASIDPLHRVGLELAMHVVAAKPLFLTKELVSSEAMENEREILKSQVASDVRLTSMLPPSTERLCFLNCKIVTCR